MPVQWNILGDQPNIGQHFLSGMQLGQQQRQQQAQRNALQAFARNPDDPQAMELMIQADPATAIKLREEQRARQTAEQQRQTQMAVARGDPGAMEQLAGFNFDAWAKLQPDKKELVKRTTSFMGQAVLDVSRLPEAQRPAAWASYVQQAEASGMDIPAHYEKYSPQALNAAAAEAGTMDKLISQFEPDWKVIPQGGYMENVNPLSRSTPITGAPQGAPPLPPGFQIDGEGGAPQPGARPFP